MNYRSCIFIVCSVLPGCGPTGGPDGDTESTTLDTSGGGGTVEPTGKPGGDTESTTLDTSGGAAEPTFEACSEDADCPTSAPLCWSERRQREDGEAGDVYWVEVSLCTRACETDVDCGAGGAADPRCLTIDGQRLCGRDCDHCVGMKGLDCVYPIISEDLCANVAYE